MDDAMTAPDMIPDDARGYNGELADSFGFQERDVLITAKYGYGGTSAAAVARRAAGQPVRILVKERV